MGADKQRSGAVDTAMALEPVYLSFNDGPDPRHTPYLLDMLAERGASASFLVRVSRAARYPYLIRRMQKEGHTVGHLGFSGVHPALLGRQKACAEFDRATVLLEDLLGAPVRLFRPPFERGCQVMIERAIHHGQRIFGWDTEVPDIWPLASPRRIAAALQAARARSCVLLHDGSSLLHRPQCALTVLNRYLYGLQFRGLRCAAFPLEWSGFSLKAQSALRASRQRPPQNQAHAA